MDVDALNAAIGRALSDYQERERTDVGRGLPPGLREGLLAHQSSRDLDTLLSAQPEFAKPLMISVLSGSMGFAPVLPKRIDTWSLTSLQQRLVKTGGRLIKHARDYWLLLAESHLTRRLFGAMLRRIWALPVPTG